MKISLYNSKFWFIVILQILSFIFLIIPMIMGLPTIMGLDPYLIMILYIFFEIMIFIPILYNKKKKYFYLGWELQIFLTALLILLFDFERTFKLSNEAEPITVASFVFFLLFVQSIILLYFILGERVIKKILFILAASTTLIVIIMIGFITNEGMQTFNDTNPIDFLTGTTWQPNYQDSSSYTLKITSEVRAYQFQLNTNEDSPYIVPGNDINLSFEIENTGTSDDTFNVTFTHDSTLNIILKNNTFNLAAANTQTVDFTLSTENEGQYNLSFIVESQKTKINKTLEYTITCSNNGVDISPDEIEEIAYGINADKVRPILTIKNVGTIEDVYTLCVTSPNHFVPTLYGEDINWSYSTSCGTLLLGPGESRDLTLVPGIKYISKDFEGSYEIITTVKSNNTNIEDTCVFTFTYVDSEEFFYTEQNNKFVAPQGSVNYTFDLIGINNQEYIITINGNEQLWDNVLILNNTEIIKGNNEAKITINESEIAILTLTVTPSETLNEGDIQELSITVTKPGSKPTFGILPFIVGTISTSIIAILIATPLSLLCAIFLSEYCGKKLRNMLKPLFELLAGIPSVIYGLWGFIVFGPFLAQYIFPFFGYKSVFGESIITASIVLSIMILPIVLTLSDDSIKAVKKDMREASLALGATKWQTTRHVLLPMAKSGIIASVILALGRAIGETMAVLMIMGPVTSMPDSIFHPAGTMSSIIASSVGWAFSFPLARHALFAVALVLFIMIFFLNIVIFSIQKKDNKKSRSVKFLSNKVKKLINFIKIKKSRPKFIVLSYGDESKNKSNNEPLLKGFKTKSTKNVLRNDKIVRVILISAIIVVVSFLFLILGDIIIRGGLSLKLDYLYLEEIGSEGAGGFANGLIGSLYLIGIAIAFALPLALGAAIYTQEYVRPSNIFTKIILFASDTLASTPSIVFGAFGFIFFVLYFRYGFSLMAGGLTLGIMIIPILLRSCIEAIKSVPQDYREGSMALGATKWQTITNVVIPPASPMISSGVILGVGRAIGETAAIMFTAGYTAHIVTSLLSPAASMPNLIYNNFSLSIRHPMLLEKVYSAAFLLIIIVLILNIIARLFSRRASRMMKN